MTPAEKALIEAAIAFDPEMRIDLDRPRLKFYGLVSRIIQERMGPGMMDELKESLRAECRATRACNKLWSKLPDFMQHDLRSRMVDEIWKEEGWE